MASSFIEVLSCALLSWFPGAQGRETYPYFQCLTFVQPLGPSCFAMSAAECWISGELTRAAFWKEARPKPWREMVAKVTVTGALSPLMCPRGVERKSLAEPMLFPSYGGWKEQNLPLLAHCVENWWESWWVNFNSGAWSSCVKFFYPFWSWGSLRIQLSMSPQYDIWWRLVFPSCEQNSDEYCQIQV